MGFQHGQDWLHRGRGHTLLNLGGDGMWQPLEQTQGCRIIVAHPAALQTIAGPCMCLLLHSLTASSHVCRGCDVRARTTGVTVTLIDFTLSRLVTAGGEPVFCNLAADPELFKGPKGDVQVGRGVAGYVEKVITCGSHNY